MNKNTSVLLIDASLACKIGLHESIVLQRLHYWLKNPKNSGYVDEDGIKWIYNTYDEWQENFPFWNTDTIQRIFRRLEGKEDKEKGIIISKQINKSKWDRKKYYRIDYNKLTELSNTPIRALIDDSDLPLSNTPIRALIDDSDLPPSLIESVNTTGINNIYPEPPSPPTVNGNGKIKDLTAEELKKESTKEDTIIKQPSQQQAMLEALSIATGIDYHIKSNCGRLGKAAADFITAGYTSQQVRDNYIGQAAWWYRVDWRGKQNQRPKLHDISETIGGAGTELEVSGGHKLQVETDGGFY